MKFDQPLETIIEKRYSCRTYKHTKFDSKTVKSIKKYLKNYTGPLGGEVSFKLVDTGAKGSSEKKRIGSYGFIKGARYFIVSIVDKEKGNLIDLGYLFEKIILKMTELGFGTVWLGSSFYFKTFADAVQLKKQETIPAISPVGFIAEKSHLIGYLIPRVINARKRKPWDKLFFKENFRTSLSKQEAEDYTFPLEMLRLAPSAKNQQPWRVLKQKDSFHFFVKTKQDNVMDVKSPLSLIDIGIGISHFDLAVKEMNIKGELIQINPEITHIPKNHHYIATWIKK